jgi:hypothetical protein
VGYSFEQNTRNGTIGDVVDKAQGQPVEALPSIGGKSSRKQIAEFLVTKGQRLVTDAAPMAEFAVGALRAFDAEFGIESRPERIWIHGTIPSELQFVAGILEESVFQATQARFKAEDLNSFHQVLERNEKRLLHDNYTITVTSDPRWHLLLRFEFGPANDGTWSFPEKNLRTVPDKFDTDIESVEKLVDDVSARLPADYASRRETLLQLSDAVRNRLAAAIEPAINSAAAAFPQSSYEEKKALAKWINAELRRFGLALRAPKTGHPCILVATTGPRPDVGRFVFDYVDASGKRHHPMSSATLPDLEVMLDDLTRAPYGLRSRSR